MTKNKKNKKGLEFRELGLWILFVVAIIIIIIGIFMLREKGVNILKALKDLITFGR